MVLEAGTTSVSSALATGTSLFNWVVTSITSNEILTAVFVVATLIPAGVMVFKRIKNAV